jgi:hypothetical protein
MGHDEPTSASGSAVCAAQGHAPGVRPRLRGPRQRCPPPTVLLPRPGDPAAVAQPASPTAPVHLGGRQGAARALYGRATTDGGATQAQVGRFQGLGRIADARIPEAPGARTPHAGICAGAVGSLAVLPRWPPDRGRGAHPWRLVPAAAPHPEGQRAVVPHAIPRDVGGGWGLVQVSPSAAGRDGCPPCGTRIDGTV